MANDCFEELASAVDQSRPCAISKDLIFLVFGDTDSHALEPAIQRIGETPSASVRRIGETSSAKIRIPTVHNLAAYIAHLVTRLNKYLTGAVTLSADVHESIFCGLLKYVRLC